MFGAKIDKGVEVIQVKPVKRTVEGMHVREHCDPGKGLLGLTGPGLYFRAGMGRY